MGAEMTRLVLECRPRVRPQDRHPDAKESNCDHKGYVLLINDSAATTAIDEPERDHGQSEGDCKRVWLHTIHIAEILGQLGRPHNMPPAVA